MPNINKTGRFDEHNQVRSCGYSDFNGGNPANAGEGWLNNVKSSYEVNLRIGIEGSSLETN